MTHAPPGRVALRFDRGDCLIPLDVGGAGAAVAIGAAGGWRIRAIHLDSS
jgi:hypothetical protein